MRLVRNKLLLPVCLLFTSQTVLSSEDKGPTHATGEGEVKSADQYLFPVPQLENVYQAWKPIDFGHPLVDPTLHYAPPALERVHIGPDPPPKQQSSVPSSRGVHEASVAVLDSYLNADVYSLPAAPFPQYSGRSNEMGLTAREGSVFYERGQAALEEARESRQAVGSPTSTARMERSKGGGSRLEPLKSGIYYVDDPHAEFRPKPQRRRDPTADRFRFPGDTFYKEEEGSQEEAVRRMDVVDISYIPVSLLSTPPTITTTDRPYGVIVNEDFFDFASKYTTAAPPQHQQQQQQQHETVFPLGNPYQGPQQQNYRLEGVLGPPRPELSDQNYGAPRVPVKLNEWIATDSTQTFPRERELGHRQNQLRDSKELRDHVEMPTRGVDQPALLLHADRQKDLDQDCPLGIPSFLRNICRSIWQQPAMAERTDRTVSPMSSLTEQRRPGPAARQHFSFVQDNQYPVAGGAETLLQSRVGSNQPVLVDYDQQDSDAAESETLESILPPPTTTPPPLKADPKAPFAYIEQDNGGRNVAPQVMISSAGGQVAVYRPDQAKPTTTPEPPVVPYQYQPALFEVASPASDAVVVAPGPRQPLSPPSMHQHQQTVTATAANRRANRPLLFAKRRPENSGEGSQVSRPFEYLSKLSNFLSDRVFGGDTAAAANRRTSSSRVNTPRPQLITRRVPLLSSAQR